MEYLLITVASLMFSLQFLFNQQFQKRTGNGIDVAMMFSFLTSVAGMVLMLFINKFHMEFSWFSLCMAAISASSGILYTIAAIKAFETVNLGMYSVFAMLGGMLLPFVYGIAFRSEPLTLPKVLCCILIAAAMMLTVNDRSLGEKKNLLWYGLIFVLNGASGVIASIHQSNTALCVDSSSFIMLSSIVSIVLCGAWILLRGRKRCKVDFPAFAASVGYAAFNKVGNLFLLIALLTLPSSIQYPVVTGGTMIFAALISLVRRETFTRRNALALVIAFASAVVIIL